MDELGGRRATRAACGTKMPRGVQSRARSDAEHDGEYDCSSFSHQAFFSAERLLLCARRHISVLLTAPVVFRLPHSPVRLFLRALTGNFGAAGPHNLEVESHAFGRRC